MAKQEASGHLTSASIVAWIIVNYSPIRVSWAFLAFCDRGGVDSPSPFSENNVIAEVGQLNLA